MQREVNVRAGNLSFVARSVVGAASLFLTGTAFATVVTPVASDFAAGTDVGFAPKTDDLINQGRATYSPPQGGSGYSPFTLDNTNFTDVNALNDGQLGSQGTVNNKVTADLADGAWTSIFNLNLNPNTGGSATGYDVSGVDTISGWPDQRASQKYELLYSTIASPSTFISLGTFSVTANNGSLRVKVRDTTGVLATQVAAIEINFQKPAGNAETVYREVDVLGAPSAVPEPGSLSILALGLLSLRRRRVQSAS